jgi:hypothetical protein
MSTVDRDAKKGHSMFTPRTTITRFAPVIGALAIATILAACGAGIGAPPPTAVAVPNTPAPIQPAPDPTPGGSENPGTDPQPVRISLRNTSGQDVFVDIVDRSGTIKRAVSGRPAEGVSVGTGTVQVENLDPRTLRLSWSDFPIDNGLSLYVDAVGVGYRFLLIQPAPTGPSDAIAEDRILELTFDHDISSAEVEAFLQEGLDTSN